MEQKISRIWKYNSKVYLKIWFSKCFGIIEEKKWLNMIVESPCIYPYTYTKAQCIWYYILLWYVARVYALYSDVYSRGKSYKTAVFASIRAHTPICMCVMYAYIILILCKRRRWHTWNTMTGWPSSWPGP